jgi:hypothetical protein
LQTQVAHVDFEPGVNPTILCYNASAVKNYNASAVKNYNATSSRERFENKYIFSYNGKNALAYYYNAGAVVLDL